MNFHSRSRPSDYYVLLPILLIITMLTPSGSGATAAEAGVTPAKVTRTFSLKRAGELSRRQQLPLLLMLSITDCAFCIKLENQVLIPMLRSGEYSDKVIIRKIVTDHSKMIEDFDGRRIPMKRLMQRYKVAIYPTVLFVDHRGRELSGRLIGINSVEMYNWDVDVAIEDANAKLNRPPAKPADTRGARAEDPNPYY